MPVAADSSAQVLSQSKCLRQGACVEQQRDASSATPAVQASCATHGKQRAFGACACEIGEMLTATAAQRHVFASCPSAGPERHPFVSHHHVCNHEKQLAVRVETKTRSRQDLCAKCDQLDMHARNSDRLTLDDWRSQYKRMREWRAKLHRQFFNADWSVRARVMCSSRLPCNRTSYARNQAATTLSVARERIT